MAIRKGAGLVVAVLAVAALLAGCSSSNSYDREDFITSLTDGGIPADQAACIADGVEGQIDLQALEDQDELTAEQEATLTDITRECVAASPTDSGAETGGDSGTESQPETGEGGNDAG